MRVPHVPRAQALDDGNEEIAFFPGYDTPGRHPVTNGYRHRHVYFLRSSFASSLRRGRSFALPRHS